MDKEDLSDMFRRAAWEKMQPAGEEEMSLLSELRSMFNVSDDPRIKYNCYVCSKLIGRDNSDTFFLLQLIVKIKKI